MTSGRHKDPIKFHVFAAELCSYSQMSVLDSCDDSKVSEDSKYVRLNHRGVDITR